MTAVRHTRHRAVRLAPFPRRPMALVNLLLMQAVVLPPVDRPAARRPEITRARRRMVKDRLTVTTKDHRRARRPMRAMEPRRQKMVRVEEARRVMPGRLHRHRPLKANDISIAHEKPAPEKAGFFSFALMLYTQLIDIFGKLGMGLRFSSGTTPPNMSK